MKTQSDPLDPRALANNPRWELVLRIAASAQFAKASRLKDFLFYIAERTLTDRLDEITEQQIGTHVFERDSLYNPSEDNIVRVNARYLRNKLKEYFEGPGAGEPEILEVPKGSYVVAFHERTAEAPVMPPARSYPRWAPLALIAILTVVCIWLWAENRRLKSAAGPKTPPENLVGALLLSHDRRACVVAADTSLVMFQRFTHREIAVEEYAERKYLSDFASSMPNAEYVSLWKYLLTRPYTSFADLSLYNQIVTANPGAIDRLSVRHARSLQPQDFKNGNYLLVGSPQSNPWGALFEPQLNFRFRSWAERERVGILNVSPRPGEPATYISEAPGEVSGEAYAIVALVTNLGGNGVVMLIGGTSSEATQAAGEYSLDPATPGALRARFHVSDLLRNLDSFQLLLRTSAIGGTARGATVIADRVQAHR